MLRHHDTQIKQLQIQKCKIFIPLYVATRGYYRSFIFTSDMSFHWKNIWRTRVPPRVAFFL